MIMAYYRFTRENGRTWTLKCERVYDADQLLEICNKAFEEDSENFLDALYKKGISGMMPQIPPSYDFLIDQKADGTFEVTKNIRYSIVKFGGFGNLVRVTDKIYENKDEAEQDLEKYKRIYGETVFISQK
jgi:hypothetical protein